MTKQSSGPSKSKTQTKTGAGTNKKSSSHKNKLGVKNSLVNNINAKKEKGSSRSKKDSTVSKKSYDQMEKDWK